MKSKSYPVDKYFPEERERIALLRMLPCSLLTALPLWGLCSNGNYLSANDFISGSVLSNEEMCTIANQSGISGLLLAGKRLVSSQQELGAENIHKYLRSIKTQAAVWRS